VRVFKDRHYGRLIGEILLQAEQLFEQPGLGRVNISIRTESSGTQPWPAHAQQPDEPCGHHIQHQ
jgi:hypothetical protein